MRTFLRLLHLWLALVFATPLWAQTPIELDRILAVVNDDIIMRSELDTAMRTIAQQLEQQGRPVPPASILERQVLERLIIMRLQLQLANSTGIRVDDETLNRTIQNIAAQNGLSLSAFRDVLERDGFSFAKFREDVRNEIIISRLQQRQVLNRIAVSEQEVDNFLSNQEAQGRQSTRYRLAHILIAVPEGASPEQIQEARAKAQQVHDELLAGADFAAKAAAVSAGQQALEGGDLGWREAGQIPTLFVDTVLKMKPGEISAPIRSPSGFHIVKLVDVQDSAEKHIITQTHARHILIRPNEVVSVADARLRLEQLRERILAGADFAALARAHSDDSGSAVKGGDLGWVNPGTMVPRFEEAMNQLEPGMVSEPFETEFGWHIVQVLARREHDSTEEFNRSRARELIRQRKAEEELELWLRRLRDEAYVEYRLEDRG